MTCSSQARMPEMAERSDSSLQRVVRVSKGLGGVVADMTGTQVEMGRDWVQDARWRKESEAQVSRGRVAAKARGRDGIGSGDG